MGNSKGYTYFVLLNSNNAGYGFNGYIDKEGIHRYIERGRDDRGNILYRRFKFTPARRMISIPNSQQDVIKFLREHPECAGSPNGSYNTDENGNKVQNQVWFKEINEGKDAEISIEATERKFEATSAALSLKAPSKGKELKHVALLCGYDGDDRKLALHHILQFAENNPDRFLEIYKDPTKEVQYLIKNGLKKGGYLRKKGFIIYWQEVKLGNSFENAVKRLLDDAELLDAIKEDAKRSGE